MSRFRMGRSAPLGYDPNELNLLEPGADVRYTKRMLVTIILATRNAHKVQEISRILGPGFLCLDLKSFPGAPTVVEDAGTFAGNATKKAVELARFISNIATAQFKLIFAAEAHGNEWYVLADDSGLEVDALDGAPGVHSARFAALDANAPTNSPDAANNDKLLRWLETVPEAKRQARFRCVLALAPIVPPEPVTSSPVCALEEIELRTELFEGTCEGRIAFHPSGGGGFGYDPLFIPEGFNQSFAELGEEVKNRISHRAHALEKLRKRFESSVR
ncbi:MAG: non-canonical purine NTP pyrophosphatase [Verrucomicrobiota bacterium]